MSSSEQTDQNFTELVFELSAMCSKAIDDGQLDAIKNEDLGQIFASIVRVYAAKAQAGPAPFPFARNSMVTQTDVAIGCTAMLDGVGMQVFDLGMWQDMSGIGRLEYEETIGSGDAE
jgi:hypothetical protein